MKYVYLIISEQVVSYIRSLEARVLLLETEKHQLEEELVKVESDS